MTGDEHPGPNWQDELARRLAVSAVRTTQVAAEFPALHQDFADHIRRIAGAPPGSGEQIAAAGALGSWLARVGVTGDSAVRTLTRALGSALLKHLEPADPETTVSVLAAVAGGYGESIRMVTFDQQEHMKRALLRAKRDVERDLFASESQFGAVFTSAAVGIAISDLDGLVVQANPALRRMVGRSERELTGLPIVELFPREDVDQLRTGYDGLRRTSRVGNRFTHNAQLSLPDGDTNWVEVSVALLCDESGRADHYATIFTDVSDTYLLAQRLSQQTLHDVVTNRPNRQFLESRLAEVIEHDLPCWLYHLDLDGFARHNDRFGRRVGDQVLRVTADRLTAWTHGEHRLADGDGGEHAMVARADGDQFLLLLAPAPANGTPHQPATRLLDVIREPITIADPALAEATVVLTASLGIAAHPGAGADGDAEPNHLAEELLRQAAQALRRARDDGGDRIHPAAI